jgi:protein LSM12
MLFLERTFNLPWSGWVYKYANTRSLSLPTRWADTQIVVSDSVLIQAPYTVDSIRAPADKAQAENHVRKVVEHYYQRKKAVTSGARNSVATPIAPRKGG